MITSSKFFDKSLFLQESVQNPNHSEELSPWEVSQPKQTLSVLKQQSSLQLHDRPPKT